MAWPKKKKERRRTQIISYKKEFLKVFRERRKTDDILKS